jgi:hypothetical protein
MNKDTMSEVVGLPDRPRDETPDRSGSVDLRSSSDLPSGRGSTKEWFWPLVRTILLIIGGLVLLLVNYGMSRLGDQLLRQGVDPTGGLIPFLVAGCIDVMGVLAVVWLPGWSESPSFKITSLGCGGSLLTTVTFGVLVGSTWFIPYSVGSPIYFRYFFGFVPFAGVVWLLSLAGLSLSIGDTRTLRDGAAMGPNNGLNYQKARQGVILSVLSILGTTSVLGCMFCSLFAAL